MKKIQVSKQIPRKYRIEYVYGSDTRVEECNDLYDSWVIIAQYVLQQNIEFGDDNPCLEALLTLAPLFNMTEDEMRKDERLLTSLSQFELFCFIYDNETYFDATYVCDYIRIYEIDRSYGIQVDLDDMKEWLLRHDFIQ